MADVEERWAALGIGTTHIAPTRLLSALNSPLERQELIADIIVLASERETSSTMLTNLLDAPFAIDLIDRIRQLSENVAMPDGRRWSAIPIRTMNRVNHPLNALAFVAKLLKVKYSDVSAYELPRSDDFGAAVLRSDVRHYRQAVLDELDNLGFIVGYEAGRYRIGPALGRRPHLVGRYYYGPGDKRGEPFVTVDRDLLGIQLEVELLETLLNKEDASEVDFQHFFENHPHFLSSLARPMAHVQLRDATGRLLVPDFVLKPLIAVQRDSRWEVLDLKKPQASLLVGRGSRRRLSHDVQEAVRQLRDYGDYFADVRNSEAVQHALGHRLRRPKLGVLIGRLPVEEVEALELEQSRLPDVRIITYDEILDQQKSLVS
jgi:hypothetical protein